MDNNRLQAAADDFDAPEFLDPGSAISSFRASSLSSIATNGVSTSRESSTFTGPSSPAYDTLSTFKPLAINPHGTIADNSSATFPLFATRVGPKRVQTSWIDTVVSPINDETQTEARDSIQAAVWLCDLRNSGTARLDKRAHELDVDAKSESPVQKPKRIRVRTIEALGTNVASRPPAASSPKPNHGFIIAPSKHKPARTLLPARQTPIELIPSVPEAAPERIGDSKLSQNFVPGRGWTAVNSEPETLPHPEDDLTIKINTIIPAPHTPAGTNYRRQMSAANSLVSIHNALLASGFETASQTSPLQAVEPSFERSRGPLLLGGCLSRATVNPSTSRVASKARKAKRASNTTTARGSAKASNRAKISAKARGLNPSILPTPEAPTLPPPPLRRGGDPNDPADPSHP